MLLLIALVALSTVACESESSAPATGRVNVLLTDAPIDLSTVDAVNVTLGKMILFGPGEAEADEDGSEMQRAGVSGDEQLTLNLLDYRDGVTLAVASLDVPAGDYRRIRMYVERAELVMANPDDETAPIVEPVDVPSRKVDVSVDFVVKGGESAEVVLDFDAAQSVQVNETQGGNKQYVLRPVITPVAVTRR
jgi:hypothetical protein